MGEDLPRYHLSPQSIWEEGFFKLSLILYTSPDL